MSFSAAFFESTAVARVYRGSTLVFDSGVAQLLQTGLVAEHRFDGPVDSQFIIDHSGNGHHVQLGSTSGADTNDPSRNASGWVTGDGVDDFAAVDPGVAIQEGSFSLLVRPNFTPDGTAIRQALAFGGGQMKVTLDHTNATFAQAIECRRASDNAFLAASFGAITSGTWVVIHGVFDGTDLKAFKNGVLQTTTPFNGVAHTAHQMINLFSGVDSANPATKIGFAACSAAWLITRTHPSTDQEIADEYQYIRFHAATKGITLPEQGDPPPATSHHIGDLITAAGWSHESPALPSDKTWPTERLYLDDPPYSAAGDGSTDDIATINTFLADAKSQNRIAVFNKAETPGKVYRCNGKISTTTVTGWNNLLWEGNGATLFIDTGASATSGNAFLQPTQCTGGRIYDLIVDGNRANRGTAESFSGHNIQPLSCHDFAFVRCQSNEAPTDGWRIAGQTTTINLANVPTWNALIDCDANHCSRLGASVIHSIDCYIVNGSYTNTDARAPAAGIDLEPTGGALTYDGTGVSIDRCFIFGVTFSGNRHDGIHIANLGTVPLEDVKIRDCTVDDNAGRNLTAGSSQSHAPIYIGTRVNGGEITGCTLSNHTDQETGSLLRGTCIYFAIGELGGWLVDSNQFANNSGFLSTITVSRYQIGAHPNTTFAGGITITDNVEIDIRNTGSGGVNVVGSSPTGNVCRRTAADGTAFVQNAGGNTTITE